MADSFIGSVKSKLGIPSIPVDRMLYENRGNREELESKNTEEYG